MIDFPVNPAPCPLQVPGVVLRPCRAEDSRFLLRLYGQTREAELAAMNWPEEMRKSFCLQQFTAQHTDWTTRLAGAHFLLLVSRGQPVGRLYVHVGEEDIRLIEVAVLAARQGQGIGSAILQALQVLAAERSVPLRLAVLHRNPRAQALYQRMGFRPEGQTADRLQMVWQPQG